MDPEEEFIVPPTILSAAVPLDLGRIIPMLGNTGRQQLVRMMERGEVTNF